MNRRALMTAGFAVAGAKAIDKSVAWLFQELDANERYAVWLCTGTADGTPVADEVIACLPGLIDRGYLVRYELPEDHWTGMSCYHKATAKGRRALDRMGFDSDRDAYVPEPS